MASKEGGPKSSEAVVDMAKTAAVVLFLATFAFLFIGAFAAGAARR
jgi:hypothetical protein